MSNKDIAKLLESRNSCFSLQDVLVLSIPKETVTSIKTATSIENITTEKAKATLCYKSRYTNLNIKVQEPAIFVCDLNELTIEDETLWDIYTMELSELVETLAIIDTAMGQSFLAKKATRESDENQLGEFILFDDEISAPILIKNIVIDLIIKKQPLFDDWCDVLRRYEAYGMMRFLISAAQQDKNANINQLCARYGISASYFRQLYRENFNKTAKRKIMGVRMGAAILQLIESESSILDVGLEAGYCSASHFTNDLKKELGLTPSEIRHLGATLYEQ
ncbi:AraC family transcriptional regulator [Providencia zhijiangensis]|uniref:AraC family transcriptional regulator n=1 Tax=Providencia zhijiangensis TaxID=3053982 RepID=A0ABZ0N3L7_9GAMM|nr:AraC family transcriptional regulator [Providencia sp. D4759]WPA92342.1 AraC family transcriptional regulator [Providencia sp. D4759]